MTAYVNKVPSDTLRRAARRYAEQQAPGGCRCDPGPYLDDDRPIRLCDWCIEYLFAVSHPEEVTPHADRLAI